MKTLVKIIAAPFVMAAVAYGTYRFIYPAYSWHQKMTLTIDTPDGEVSGGNVTWVRVAAQPQPLPQIGAQNFDFSGEAGVIEVREGKYLFALIRGGHVWRVGQDTFLKSDRKYYKGGKVAFAKHIANWPDSEDIPRKNYPTLVTFGDINDPSSVKRVDVDDLDGAFGISTNCGVADVNAPWRAQGLTWRKWEENNREMNARNKALALAGYTGEAAKILLDMDDLWDGRYKNVHADEIAKLRLAGVPLEKSETSVDTPEELFARKIARLKWDNARPVSTPRDTSNDCHQLKSITLEITDEPVTEGRVEEVLEWLGQHPEIKLGPATGQITNIPFNRRISYGNFIRRN